MTVWLELQKIDKQQWCLKYRKLTIYFCLCYSPCLVFLSLTREGKGSLVGVSEIRSIAICCVPHEICSKKEIGLTQHFVLFCTVQ